MTALNTKKKKKKFVFFDLNIAEIKTFGTVPLLTIEADKLKKQAKKKKKKWRNTKLFW